MAEAGGRGRLAHGVKSGVVDGKVSFAGSRLPEGGVNPMELLTEILKLASTLLGLVNGVLTFPSKASRSNDEQGKNR